jgi:hypothetical protein
MAKMRWGTDIDWDSLEEEEYSEDEFDDYDGPVPPSNAILRGYIKKIWGTESSNGDAMLKVLFIADGNEGDRKVYDGWPGWDNVLFSLPQVKFRWQPFFDAIGVTLADLKSRTVVGEEENQGDLITRIGKVRFDGRSPVEVRVKTKREKYEGETQCRIAKFLPAADVAADEDDEDGDDGDDWGGDEEPDDFAD